MTRTRHPLDAVRSDGWFDRVLAGVPALVRLSAGVGEALVALSLVAGFRITAATVDRATANVSELQWVREGAEGAGPADRGTPEMLRDAVLLALHDEPPGRLPAGKVDDDALRELVGVRTILLAPLFGVELRAVLVGDGPTMLALGTDQGEVEVPLEEVQRFLRGRVVEVLRAPRGRGATVDRAQRDGVPRPVQLGDRAGERGEDDRGCRIDRDAVADGPRCEHGIRHGGERDEDAGQGGEDREWRV